MIRREKTQKFFPEPQTRCPMFSIQRLPPFGKRFFKRIRKILGCYITSACQSDLNEVVSLTPPTVVTGKYFTILQKFSLRKQLLLFDL